MRLLKARSFITGITAALLLAVGTFTSTAVLADHSSHRQGQQQRYFHNGHRQQHDNRNHRGWRPGWQHSYSYNRHRGYGNRSYGHSHHHKPRRLNRRHHRHYNHGRGYYRGGHYRSNDLVGALIGGAIIYHIGRELSRH